MPIDDRAYCTEDDYYTVKRFLETKAKVAAIFSNKERAEAVKNFIKDKNKIKDDMVKIAEDDSYSKALGLEES